MKTNLAFVLEPGETGETEVLNAAMLDEMLRVGSRPAAIGSRPRTHAARGRRVLVSFQDNHSDLFKPFRIY